MLGKSADPSDFLARRRRAVILQTQRSKGKYVQIENKSMGFDNGVLQVLGSRGLDSYLPKPLPFVPPVCIGTYSRGPGADAGTLTVTQSGYSFTGIANNQLSVPLIQVYSGFRGSYPGIVGNFSFALVNCTGASLVITVYGNSVTLPTGQYLYGAVGAFVVVTTVTIDAV